MGEAARPRPGAKYDATPCKILDLILKTVSAYSCKGVGGSADVTSRSWCSPSAGWPVPPGGWGCGALMVEARSRQRDEEVGIRRVFWCPVSVVQPTAKRTAPTAPPLDRGQGHPQAAPAGQFRQADCLGRPAVCGWRREGSLGQMPAERPPSLGVTPYCAGSECACPGVSRADRLRSRRRSGTGCRSRGGPRSRRGAPPGREWRAPRAAAGSPRRECRRS